MSERPPGQTPPPSVEENPEHIPTPEEIHDVVKQMVKGMECKEAARYLDEEGNIRRLDMVATGTEEGETLELFYGRKVYPNTEKPTEININSAWMKDGLQPLGEGPQADFIDGKWKIVE